MISTCILPLKNEKGFIDNDGSTYGAIVAFLIVTSDGDKYYNHSHKSYPITEDGDVLNISSEEGKLVSCLKRGTPLYERAFEFANCMGMDQDEFEKDCEAKAIRIIL